MSNDADKAIKAVLLEFGEAWSESTVWRVQGTAVISHKALERIAARAGIRFDLPTIVRAERDEAVILVVGHRGEMREWSIGECVVNVNYRVSGKQAAYVFAMAEKRAKDRVILKLLSLHGMAYSEEEADDFKASGQGKAGEPEAPSPRDQYIESCRIAIREATDPQKLGAWWNSESEKRARRDFGLSQDEVDSLKAAFGDRLRALAPRAA